MPEENVPLLGQPQQQEIKYPAFQILVADKGILLECFLGPGISIKFTLDENTVNNVLQEWVKSRKNIHDLQTIGLRAVQEKRKGFN